jgi:hypothetical protein
MYVHYPVSTDHGLGCLWTPWMCTIQVYPSSKLPVDWICSGLAGRRWVPWAEVGWVSNHMIPHKLGWAEIYSTPASFAWHIEHKCTPNWTDKTWWTPGFFCREHLLQCLQVNEPFKCKLAFYLCSSLKRFISHLKKLSDRYPWKQLTDSETWHITVDNREIFFSVNFVNLFFSLPQDTDEKIKFKKTKTMREK